MAWKECLFLEASKETGGEFQMQCLGSVKEIYQDKTFSHYLPHRHFSASLLKQLMQPLSGKYGEHKGEEVQWGPGGLFKKILLQQLECSYHIDWFVWPLSTPFSKKMAGERGQMKTVWSIIIFRNCKDNFQTHLLRAWGCVQPLRGHVSFQSFLHPCCFCCLHGSYPKGIQTCNQVLFSHMRQHFPFSGPQSGNVSKIELIIAKPHSCESHFH